MGRKLFVGNLGFDASDADLSQLFGLHGTVASASVCMDRATSRSKGFGFVEMGSDAEGQAAITALHGKDHNGRPLTVAEAKPKVSSGDRR